MVVLDIWVFAVFFFTKKYMFNRHMGNHESKAETAIEGRGAGCSRCLE